MKRVFAHSVSALALATLATASVAGCDINLPVDSKNGNPEIPAPMGIIQGNVTYYGPSPCVKDGHVEGVMIVLLFQFSNPPPPDGLATTALNIATVPGDKLFPNAVIPATGPGSSSDAKHQSVCGTASSLVTATAPFTLSELVAERYQVRAFYSEHGSFNPLFDFANLPIAGDVGGAALSDPTTGKLQEIIVGLPTTDLLHHPNGLMIPDAGFVTSNVSVLVGQPFLTSRPYFWIDPKGSRGFINEKAPQKGETQVAWPQADTAQDDTFVPRFPQDLNITGNQNLSCVLNPDPSCDAFQYAQASLPQVHLHYGFPNPGTLLSAKAANIVAGDDLGIARSARIKDPLVAGGTPFYGLEPFPIDLGATDVTKTKSDPSQRFNLTRVYETDPDTGQLVPAILHDNDSLQLQGLVADLYPLVVFAKLQEGPTGVPVDPPTPQSDPVVIIQGITLRNDKNGNGTMKATSEGSLPCGGLTKPVTDSTGTIVECDPDPSQALESSTGVELLGNFTTLVRPATLCVRPNAANANPPGVLVAPFETDFNPASLGTQIVSVANIKKFQASKVADVQFGCMPPGYYTVNVVYPAGQAWSVPNNTGDCTFGLAKLIDGTWNDGQTFEACAYGSPSAPGFAYPYAAPTGANLTNGTSGRPLLVSQQLFLDGAPHGTKGRNTQPLIVRIDPSARCMSTVDEKPGQDLNHNGITGEKGVLVNHPVNEDANHDGILQPGEDKNGNGMLDLNMPNACLPLCRRDANGNIVAAESGSTMCSPN